MVMSHGMRDRLRRISPWWAKVALKLFLAKVPMAHALLRRCGLARHGGMERPQWAFDTFRRHFDRLEFRNKAGGFTALELGPGDSLFSALIARAYGAASVTLIDVAAFANTDLQLYRDMALFLRSKGLEAPDLSAAASLDDVLSACRARYETAGLASLKTLPSGSIDFIFSNAVLQHVARGEVAPTLRELRRVVHPEGASIHSVDLRDTIGGSLQHLQFHERTWESDWFRRAGFYTNRLRLSELLAIAREAGFETCVDEVNRWDRLPVRREKLDRAYRAMADEDLLTATARIVLRPLHRSPHAQQAGRAMAVTR
jgi:SAM-dependent methyltransferase